MAKQFINTMSNYPMLDNYILPHHWVYTNKIQDHRIQFFLSNALLSRKHKFNSKNPISTLFTKNPQKPRKQTKSPSGSTLRVHRKTGHYKPLLRAHYSELAHWSGIQAHCACTTQMVDASQLGATLMLPGFVDKDTRVTEEYPPQGFTHM